MGSCRAAQRNDAPLTSVALDTKNTAIYQAIVLLGALSPRWCAVYYPASSYGSTWIATVRERSRPDQGTGGIDQLRSVVLCLSGAKNWGAHIHPMQDRHNPIHIIQSMPTCVRTTSIFTSHEPWMRRRGLSSPHGCPVPSHHKQTIPVLLLRLWQQSTTSHPLPGTKSQGSRFSNQPR